jgi:hypothetical protein
MKQTEKEVHLQENADLNQALNKFLLKNKIYVTVRICVSSGKQ